jgi:hypothetical protein
MYFEKIPLIPYPVLKGHRVLRDITLNIRFKREVIENTNIYAEYDIEDKETPEIIAEKLYKNPNLYWVIMLFNQRYDYVEDFPLSEWALTEYIKRKYGNGNEYNQHRIGGCLHFETPDGYIVDGDFPQATPITNYDYEFGLNESKRRIKIIDPSLIPDLQKEIETIYG